MLNARKLSLLTVLLLVSNMAFAAQYRLLPQDNIQARFDLAQAGDHILLAAGVYRGNFVLRQSVILSGEAGAILDGQGKGHTLQIQAPDTEVAGLEIRGWGRDLTALDSGIFIHKSATNTRVSDNRLYGDSFGIWVDATQGVTLRNNKIEGNLAIRSQDRGNGIHLFNVTQARIEGNEVWHTRDGIYIDTSNHNALINNYLHDLRYGVHYMYSYHNRVVGNRTYRTRTGYALMQSKYLTVLNNRSDDDQNYGILMNYITHSRIQNNQVSGVRNSDETFSAGVADSEGKALFIYNSLFNEVVHNTFANSDMGVHLTAGSENNVLSGNAFIGNREQVKYVATRHQDWSHEGVGNYWSDYVGWDMDADGIGDTQYEPMDGVDRLLWKYPGARVLLNSPAVETLRWVQRQFPVLKAQGVVDSHPLMRIPVREEQPDETAVMGRHDDKHS